MVEDWSDSDRLRRAVLIAGLGHYVWDVVEDKCLVCSEEHAALHGLRVDEYIEKSSTQNGLTHPDDLEIVREAFQRLKLGEPFELEYRIMTPDGRIRYIREIGHPIRNDDGIVVRELGTSQDITSQKEREIALSDAEEALHISIQALPFGFASYGPDDRLQYFNEEYRRLLPFSAHLLRPGMHVEDLMRNSAHIVGPACGFDNVEEYVQARLESNRDASKDWTYRQSNGRWVTNSKTPKRDGGFVSVLRDITKARERDRQLAQANKMKAVGLLTGGISHDFNNLMSVVSGSLQLLEHTSDERERAELTKTAFRAIEHGTNLTRQMLALGHQSPLLEKPTDLKLAVEEFISFAKRVLPENIDIVLRDETSRLVATVDQGMLQNALLNLALNSKEAMPKGGTLSIELTNEITLKKEGFDEPTTIEYAIISVTDSGEGITEDVLEQVYEPFFTTREIGKGSGLGLSMVKGFVEQSDGRIQISSEAGEGTTVLLCFPITCDEPVSESEGLTPETSEKRRRKGSRILLVEDSPQLLELVALQLKRDGYDVLKTRSGDEAVAYLSGEGAVDAVLSDVVMPGVLQGIDVLRYAKGLGVPVMLMSGYADLRSSEEIDLRDADVFLEKPLKLSQLSQKIEELFNLVSDK